MASDIIPILAMVIVQVGYAGMNITSKLAMESGMNLLVLVTYRQIFGALAIIPFALWLERKVRPRMTMAILFQIFVCSLTGATGNQVLYFVGLRNSTPTVACAINNVLPAITFILAAVCRQESVGMKTRRGQAKVIGTLVGIAGALVLSFYHGKSIGLGESRIHWKYADKLTQETNSADRGNSILGSFAVIASCVSLSIWFIVQAKLSQKFPAPYTSSSFICILSSIQCALIAMCFEHRPAAWSLTNSMRLTSSLYAGIVCNGITFCLMSWTIQRKGPLFVSVFNPLLLVIVAFLSWALLREKLYVGTAIGSLLIVLGLYAVLWGKKEEVKSIEGMRETEMGMKDNKQVQPTDLELQ